MTDLANPTTSDKLRFLRKQKRLSQHAAAARLEISPRIYISYECNGSIPASPDLCKAIADLYEVDVIWLFGEDACRQRMCKHCGKPLPGNAHKSKQYCSSACRNAAKEQRIKKSRQYTHCTVCGKLLGKYKHQFCSAECMRQAMGASKQSVQKRCKNCGELLDSNHKWYCGPECAEEYRRKSVPTKALRERYDPESGESYREFQLRTDPVFRQIYIRPGGKR